MLCKDHSNSVFKAGYSGSGGPLAAKVAEIRNEALEALEIKTNHMSLFKKLAMVAVTAVFALGVVGVSVPAMAQEVVVPVGYEKIPGPSKISQYSDIIKFPGSIDLYGKPRSVAAAPVVRTVAQTTDGGIFDGGTSNLGDLLILDAIFSGNGGGIFGGGGILGGDNNSLGNLLILDSLFGDSNGIFNGNGNTNLGNLLILDAIFSGNGGIVGDGNGTSLGNLLILDQLFNN